MTAVVSGLYTTPHSFNVILRSVSPLTYLPLFFAFDSVLDLRTEIQGERLRFVDAMARATSLNIENHVSEFKGLLSQEVTRSQKELVAIREQKQTLERECVDSPALSLLLDY